MMPQNQLSDRRPAGAAFTILMRENTHDRISASRVEYR
jgi:hypothetical protein